VTRQRTVGGKRVTEYEHRFVVEQALGRKLLPSENIHHLNGDKRDNRFPENLEIWSKAQPAGQRVVDKVKWAYELIALYDPDGKMRPRIP
jgi:hypothetical protein